MSRYQSDKLAKGHNKNYMHYYKHTVLLTDNNF